MKSKKASIFLPEKALNIILAVIVFILLIVLFTKLSNLSQSANQKEKAEGTLKEIQNAISGLEEGGEKQMTLLSPTEWYLVLEKKAILINNDLYYKLQVVFSSECDNSVGNCLCICPFVAGKPASAGTGGQGYTVDTIQCDEGVCKNIENLRDTDDLINGIEINAQNIVISKKENLITINKKT